MTSCFCEKYFRWVPFLSRCNMASRWALTSFWNDLWSSIWVRMVARTRETGFKLVKTFSAFVNQSINAYDMKKNVNKTCQMKIYSFKSKKRNNFTCRASWNSVASLRAISSLIFLSFALAVTLSQRCFNVLRLCCKLLAFGFGDFFKYSCPCASTVSTFGLFSSSSLYTS